jgi:hypothetical protein
MMRRLRLETTLGVGALIFLGAAAVHTQDLEAVRANVPFAFKIGHTVLPAGDYVLRLDDGMTPGVLSVRREDGRAGAFVLTDKTDLSKTAGDHPKLVFSNDGTQYVLAEVVDPVIGLGFQVVGTSKPNADQERVEVPTD